MLRAPEAWSPDDSKSLSISPLSLFAAARPSTRSCGASASAASRRGTGDFAQRRAVLYLRRARSGLASRRGVPAADRGVPGAALPQRQGDGAQHAALPRQNSRPALFRSRRPARPHRLARHALYAVSRAGRPATALREMFRQVGREHGASPLDLHLDAVQRRLGHRPRRQPGRPAMADRDLRRGEGAGPGEPASSTTRPASRATITSRPTSRTSTGTTASRIRTKPSRRRPAPSRPARPGRGRRTATPIKRGDEPLSARNSASGACRIRARSWTGTDASPGGSRAATIGISAPPIRMASRRASATRGSRRFSATSTGSSTRRRSSSSAR